MKVEPKLHPRLNDASRLKGTNEASGEDEDERVLASGSLAIM
jgi:hypothetical protein